MAKPKNINKPNTESPKQTQHIHAPKDILQSKTFDAKYIKYLILIGLIFITFIIFSRALSHQFLNWDDNILVYNNPYVQALTNQGFSALKNIGKEFYQSNPISIISHVIIGKIWGMTNPKPFHAINILLHLFNVILVYQFIKLLTKRYQAAAIAALIFAVHPLRVESVAWIAERKDVLYAFFYLLGLLSYLYYLSTNRKIWYIVALLMFPLSLFSKFAGVIYPFALMLIDYYYKRGITKKVILEKIPFLIILIFAGINEFTAGTTAAESVDKFSATYTFADRFFFANYSFVFYSLKFFLPLNLSAMYPYPVKIAGSLPTAYYLAPVVAVFILAGIAFIIFKFKDFRNEFIFGILFFLSNIFLVLHFVPFGGNVVVADRYTYMAHIGLGFIIGQIFYSTITNSYLNAQKVKPILITILSATFLFFMIATWSRVGVFKDTYSLFSDAIEKEPVSMTYYYRAIINVEKKDYEAAVKDFSKSIDLNPDFLMACIERGKAYREKGDFQNALLDFDKAVSRNPNSNVLYNDRGYIRQKNNDVTGAIEDFSKAISLKSDFFEAYANRANILNSINNFKDAIEDYTSAIAINPKSPSLYSFRAGVKMSYNDFKGAMEDYSIAINLSPENAEFYNARGLVKSKNLRNLKEAVLDFNKATELNSKYKEAFNNRAVAKFEIQDFNGCITDISKVIEIEPANSMALLIRGHARKNMKQMKEACDDWNRALRLGNQNAGVLLNQFCK